jgi:hypothetical protein
VSYEVIILDGSRAGSVHYLAGAGDYSTPELAHEVLMELMDVVVLGGHADAVGYVLLRTGDDVADTEVVETARARQVGSWN